MTMNVLIYIAGFLSAFALMAVPVMALLWIDFDKKPVDKTEWKQM